MRISKHLATISETQILPMNRIQVQADGKQFHYQSKSARWFFTPPREKLPLLLCNTEDGELALAEER